MATLIFFAGSIAFPFAQQKASANPLALAGGAAVGTYVLGGLAISAIALHIGRELDNDELIGVSDIIREHSDAIWNTSTEAVKQAWNEVYEAGVVTGKGLTYLPPVLKDSINAHIPDIVAAATTILGDYSMATDPTISASLASIPIGKPDNAKQANLYAAGWFGVVTYNGESRVFDYMVFNHYGSRGNIYFSNYYMGVPQTLADIGAVPAKFEFTSAYREPWDTFGQKTTYGQISGTIAAGDAKIRLHRRELWEGNSISTGVAEQLPKIDAGMVIPVRDFEMTTPDGVPLTRPNVANPDIVVTPDGVPYTGDVVVNPTIPDVYIPRDGAGTAIGNPGISVPVEGVPTDVWTGNPSVPIEGDVPIEGEVPGGNVPPGSDWNKPPSKKPPNIGGLITTKFPFSLPWDLLAVLTFLNADPMTPQWKVNQKMGENDVLPFNFEINLKFLEPYMAFFRWFIVLGFSFSLILMTRKLLGGSGS